MPITQLEYAFFCFNKRPNKGLSYLELSSILILRKLIKDQTEILLFSIHNARLFMITFLTLPLYWLGYTG